MSDSIRFKLHPFVLLGLLAVTSVAHGESIVLIRDTGGLVVDAEDVLIEARQRKVPEATLAEVLKKPDNARRMASNIYVRRLLAQQAEAAGLDKDPQVARVLKLARERVLSDLRLAQTTDAPLDEAAVARMVAHEYETSKAKFSSPEMVRVRHILIDDKGKDKDQARAEATALLVRLKAGEDFEALAKAHSGDRGSREKGGDVGFFPRGRMVQPFEAAAFALTRPGELSDLVETQFGFHILRLEERREAAVKPLDEVRPEIRQQVEGRIRGERHRGLVAPIEAKVPFVETGIEAFVSQYRKANPQAK